LPPARIVLVRNITRAIKGRNQVLDAILIIGIAMLTVDEYVVDVLMRDLVGHDRRPVSFLVYLWLAAEQQRQGKAVTISYQQLAESIGISKSSAQAAAGWLARRKLIAIKKAGFTATPSYSVQRPWISR
jgi:hypothetical protein